MSAEWHGTFEAQHIGRDSVPVARAKCGPDAAEGCGSRPEIGGSPREIGGSPSSTEGSPREAGAIAREIGGSRREIGGSPSSTEGSPREAGAIAREIGGSPSSTEGSPREAGAIAREIGGSRREIGGSPWAIEGSAWSNRAGPRKSQEARGQPDMARCHGAEASRQVIPRERAAEAAAPLMSLKQRTTGTRRSGSVY
jgi:hypothetical protein